MKPKHIITILLLFLLVNSCDIYTPQKKFRLAVPEVDFFYNLLTSELKPFLEKHDYAIEIVRASSSIEANRMVAEGKADLTFINNLSVPTAETLGSATSALRTVLPLNTRILFAFTKDPVPNMETYTIRELCENKRLGIEVLGGEAELNFKMILNRAKINGYEIVKMTDNPDVILYWGTLYGQRAQKFLDDGWHPFTFKENFINFITLNDPALRPFSLPAIPGEGKSIPIHTVATETILVTNRDIGENSIYLLADLIYQNRMELIHKDAMYRAISDDFNAQSCLYSLHEGTEAFQRRHQPTFFERYSDLIAMILSVAAVLYGAVQAIRNTLTKRRKDRIDKYYLEFLNIRQNKDFDQPQKVNLLNNLLQRALEQMTDEKLDKSDSHMLSNLIQQELTILKFREN